ncbi:MAG: hypothetical protein SF066_17125 [Thermoanaerobaculia bacterium]|nr:hypothetical protein [Thermoanaerobaculia bacterium]
MKVALASCRHLPDWEHDDRPLVAALEARGAAVETVPWDAEVDWSGFAGVLLRTTWDYMDRAEPFRAWVEHVGRVTRLENPPAVVRWNLDKRYLLELARHGVPTLPTAWLAPGADSDLGGWLAGHKAEIGFLKPVVGASAVGSLRFATSAEGLAAARRHLAETPSPAGWLLQPYLESVETLGEISAIFVGGELTHAVRKVPPPGDYRVQEDYGATDHALELGPHRTALARRTLAAAEAALGHRHPLLYGRTDYLEAADGTLYLTELELIEPALFFRHAPQAADRLAAEFLARLGLSS